MSGPSPSPRGTTAVNPFTDNFARGPHGKGYFALQPPPAAGFPDTPPRTPANPATSPDANAGSHPKGYFALHPQSAVQWPDTPPLTPANLPRSPLTPPRTPRSSHSHRRPPTPPRTPSREFFPSHTPPRTPRSSHSHRRPPTPPRTPSREFFPSHTPPRTPTIPEWALLGTPKAPLTPHRPAPPPPRIPKIPQLPPLHLGPKIIEDDTRSDDLSVQDPILAVAETVAPGLESAPLPSPQVEVLSEKAEVDAEPKSEPAAVPETTEETTPEQLLVAKGKKMVLRQKYLMDTFLVCINFLFIFATWYWPHYYYLYLPFISLPLVLNCCMIVSIVFFSIRNKIKPEKKIIPPEPEQMVLLMPCYNETLEECTKSLDSLVSQVNVEQHKKAIMIIVDGKVRGPGMEKTTGGYLNEDILTDRTSRKSIKNAYTAWDGQSMDVEITTGNYKGVPFYCIVKQQNQGKRDSLIVIRSFLYNFNRRAERPKVIFRPPFFKHMCHWLLVEAGINHCEYLIGMDADTVFDPTCIEELVKESHYANTVGVCGYVAVDFKDHPWDLWSVYQSAEYTIAQALRRLHQSVATHKVSCLPGCCQLLRICEITCGDMILLKEFGYHPKPTDSLLARIRATASEDRNHVCLMLLNFPNAQTRQALKARAYTDVPHSWSVFLSQRRRWTLGATANDFLLFTHSAPIPWVGRLPFWEWLVAMCNVLTWCLNIFVIASLGVMIYAFMHQAWYVIVAFASIMVIPLIYYALITVWMPRNLHERLQYLLGLSIFTICGPFLNISVLLYACKNMDQFGWGKTRKVIAEADGEGGDAEDCDCEADFDLSGTGKNRVPDIENQIDPNEGGVVPIYDGIYDDPEPKSSTEK